MRMNVKIVAPDRFFFCIKLVLKMIYYGIYNNYTIYSTFSFEFKCVYGLKCVCTWTRWMSVKCVLDVLALHLHDFEICLIHLKRFLFVKYDASYPKGIKYDRICFKKIFIFKICFFYLFLTLLNTLEWRKKMYFKL